MQQQIQHDDDRDDYCPNFALSVVFLTLAVLAGLVVGLWWARGM
jgi:hypothetical protein